MLFLQILGDMCLAVVCFLLFDIINFEINFIFLITPFSNQDKNILKTKKKVLRWKKAYFMLFMKFQLQKKVSDQRVCIWENLFWMTSANDCFCLLYTRPVTGVSPWYVLALQRLLHFIVCVLFLSFSFFFSYVVWSLQLAEI